MVSSLYITSESSAWSLESSGRSSPCKHKIYDHEYIITPEATFNPLLLILALLHVTWPIWPQQKVGSLSAKKKNRTANIGENNADNSKGNQY